MAETPRPPVAEQPKDPSVVEVTMIKGSDLPDQVRRNLRQIVRRARSGQMDPRKVLGAVSRELKLEPPEGTSQEQGGTK